MNRLFIIEQIQIENGYRYRIGYISKKTNNYTVCASRDTLEKAVFFVLYIAKSNNYTIKKKEV